METRFECSFETTEQNVREFARHYHFHTLYILFPLLAIIAFLGWAVYSITVHGWHGLYIFMLVFALVIYPALLLFRYRRDVKTLLARSQELHGDKPAVSHTLFSDDTITLISHEGKEHPFAYENLKQVIVTKNLLILRSKARQSILCEKKCFTKGNWTECVAFLKQKGLKVTKG